MSARAIALLFIWSLLFYRKEDNFFKSNKSSKTENAVCWTNLKAELDTKPQYSRVS